MQIREMPSAPHKARPESRRSGNYEPSPWGDYFITYTPPIVMRNEWVEQRIKELKEEVMMMFRSTTNTAEIVNLVDTIQHLGIGYHFEKEIDDALSNLLHAKLDSEDLHHVAFRFRLLRQHGFNLSSDQFCKFKDDQGNFDEKLSNDARGLLSLYNAGYLAIPGEIILDDAILFSRGHLRSMVDDLKSPLKKQVLRALKTPLHKMMTRVEARFYIEEYEEEESRNDIILELAKLDFNVVQCLHAEEMKTLSIWWKELDLGENLKYSRDRLVEFYFWVLGLYFEPQHSRARIMLVKFYSLATIVDDTFGVYGTFDECKALNDAIQRWDDKEADALPMYLRGLYLKCINTINRFEDELKPGEKYRIPHFIEATKTMINGYMKEVEWQNEGKVPTFNQRKGPSVDETAGCLALGVFLGMGDLFTEEGYLWLTSIPDVAVDCLKLFRYTDEYVSFERETKAGQGPTTIMCYMIEHNLTREAAAVKFQSFCEDAWKRVNKACLQPTDGPMPVLEQRLMNYGRLVEVLYLHFNDGFNKSSNLKEAIALLLLKPFTF